MSMSYRVDDDPLPIQSTKNVNVGTYRIKWKLWLLSHLSPTEKDCGLGINKNRRYPLIWNRD